MTDGLPLSLLDYRALVDWSGRIMREDKRGSINTNIPPILDRLNMDSKNWLFLTQHFENKLKGLVDGAFKHKQICEKRGYKRVRGLTSCQNYFP